MKARAFDYVRTHSLADAFSAFAGCDGEARYIAGGQSLLPALNLRLDAPDLLIDIAHIDSLRGVAVAGANLRIGALTRHAEILSSPLVAAHAPLLSAAAAYVAHPAIRNKGTIGGSLALADPASEFPAVVLALDARIEVNGPEGVRIVEAQHFFLGLYETALAPGEIISAVLIPVAKPEQRWFFHELARRRGDYAIVGLAVQARMTASSVAGIALAFFAVAGTPVRALAAEQALIGGALDDERVDAAKAALSEDLAPDDDVQVSGATRLHLAGVLLGRALVALRNQDQSAIKQATV